jgi:phosphocarrier protein HPr
MQNKSVTIINKLGLHARAAARFVQLASGFECEINVACSGKKVSGKSIMGIMMLAAAKGTSIEITTAGADEVEAMTKLEELILNRFGEEE